MENHNTRAADGFFYSSKSFPMKEKFVFIPLIKLLCSTYLRALLGGDSKLGTDHPEMLIIRNYVRHD